MRRVIIGTFRNSLGAITQLILMNRPWWERPLGKIKRAPNVLPITFNLTVSPSASISDACLLTRKNCPWFQVGRTYFLGLYLHSHRGSTVWPLRLSRFSFSLVLFSFTCPYSLLCLGKMPYGPSDIAMFQENACQKFRAIQNSSGPIGTLVCWARNNSSELKNAVHYSLVLGSFCSFFRLYYQFSQLVNILLPC